MTDKVFKIGTADFTAYLKDEDGIEWGRENTNDKNAGRDQGQTMHTNVTSHQRTLKIKMIPMPYTKAMELAHLLQDNDDGVQVTYPDLYDGVCTRLFYNTSITAALARFDNAGNITVKNITFTLTSVKEDRLV